MKKTLHIFIICFITLTVKLANAQTPTVASGYSIREVASGGVFAGQILDGIVADPTSGNVYVAAVSSTNSSSFNLYKITPAGTVTTIGNYSFSHNEIVKMAFNVTDGNIYTVDANTGTMKKIDPSTGASSTFANGVSGSRHGLNFDPSGNLIIAYESLHDFYRVTPGGIISLGHVSASLPNGNHGDAFGIQPDGNYVVYVDCGGQNNYSINTSGHTDGTNYTTLAWTGTTNIFSSLMPDACGYSTGAIDPNTGDVYSTIANFGNGNTRILFTAADGGATTLFVDNASGIVDLSFGKESSSGNCQSLYFIDRNLNAVYEVPMNNCCSPMPSVTNVAGGGTFCGSTTITASGGAGGTIYFQGTTSNGTSTAIASSSQTITTSGTYYFRSKISGGCWGKQGSAVVIIKPLPDVPVISPSGDPLCTDNSINLSIPAPSYSSPITYNIEEGNLVNMTGNCGGGSRYGGGQVGFSWEDVGNGIVSSVQIKFSVGVECSPGTHTSSLNSVSSPGFTTTQGWCSCGNPSTPQIFTLNFTPSTYNVGGSNTFLMSANTFGVIPATALSNYHAQVTVTYMASPILWSPGGATTSSITVSPASSTVYTVSVTGGNGCAASASKTVAVNQKITAINLTPSESTNTGGIKTNMYLGYGSTGTTLSSNGTGVVWSPSGNLSCTNCPSPVFTPTTAGNHTITATNCHGSKSVTICVKDIRVPNTSGSKAAVYMCHKEPGTTTTKTLAVLLRGIPSHFQYHSGDKLGVCGNTCATNKRNFEFETLVVDEQYLEVMCSPNPFRQSFKLHYISNSEEEATVAIYGMTGNLVETVTLAGVADEAELGSNLPNGIYTVSFIQGDKNRVFRMIKVD